MSLATDPSFEDRGFLQKHIRSILDFYEPRVVSPEGGFYQCYLDDGEIFDPVSRQVVGSSRFVVNYATAYRLQGDAHYLDWAKWGLKYLSDTHRQPNDRYKPWGFQPGHQVEWCKLLLILNNERPAPQWVTRAQALYDHAMTTGWDERYGGIVYGVAPDGQFCSAEKYFWVHADAMAFYIRMVYEEYGRFTYLVGPRRIDIQKELRLNF